MEITYFKMNVSKDFATVIDIHEFTDMFKVQLIDFLKVLKPF